MVTLSPTPLQEADVNLLPPVLPAYLLQRSRVSFRPRSADPSASTPSTSDASGTGNGSSASSSTGNLRLPRPTINLNFSGAAGIFGLGAGGSVFLGGTGSAKAVSLWPFSRRKKSVAKDDKRRILIMYSNTGGGHKASADAIKGVLHEKYGDKYEVHVVDMWKEHTPAPFNTMPNSYSFLVKNSFLWWFTYEFTNPRLVHIPYLAAVGSFTSQGISEAFDLYQPNLVVSVHPLMQHIPIGVMERRIRAGTMAPANFATVVTDFTTCHNTWFCPAATRCFVPTDYCRALAIRQGMAPGQLIMHGLPIRPAFSKPLPKRSKLRHSLGMDPHLPAVLLVGGGEGMGMLEDTVEQLDRQLGDTCQVVVICGRNQKLLDALRARPQGPGHMPLVACGFVDNIHEWMGACDAIITKAGPGTIAEALIAGLPILLNGNIPCQEEGNIPYVIDNKVGAFETRPPQIASIMARWLGPEREEFDAMAQRSKALGRPEAVYKIVEDLAALADRPFFDFGPATAALAARGKQQQQQGGKQQLQPAAA